jgi:branched-chain amino acid transport system ATP-binding protein
VTKELRTSGDTVPRTSTDAVQRTSTDAVLRTTSVTVRYGAVRALDGVDIEVARGELCGVIGPNGAGKTTLFDVISGHSVPSSGRVEVNGRDVSRRSSLWRSRHGVRRTFQRQQVFGALTVEDNIRAALDWRGGEGGFVADMVGWRARPATRRERAQRVDEVIELCGLGDVRTAYAGALPIGAARMVELGRAIADAPQLLLLDEPSSGLGEAETARLGEVVRRVRDETGCACLLVEHDVPFVMEHSDRVVVLHLGQVLAQGSPADIQADPEVQAAYLG